jgi:hypothetical protein
MVTGLDGFKAWFSGHEEQYVIIGGTACDLLLGEGGFDFRATRDIDVVLIVESLTPSFGMRFWGYITEAGYEHRNKSTGEPQFYRFMNPKGNGFPYMIELFSRRTEALPLPDSAVLTPLPLDDGLSSLSAILMDDNYYQFLRGGRTQVDGIPILDAAHIIPLKAKAWLDLSARKAAGENIDSKNIRKHKNDIFRMSVLLTPETRIRLPGSIKRDISAFMSAASLERSDMKALGLRGETQAEVLAKVAAAYIPS